MIKSETLKKRLEIICDKDFVEISDNDINSIKELNLNNADVANNPTPIYFEDLLIFKNLEVLKINNANISLEDYAYILKLKNLRSLSFYNCKLEDLINIEILEKLECIRLINSYARSIDKIGNIPNLKEVTLINHELGNINFLENVCLKSLTLGNCQIGDFSVIYNLNDLEYLDVDNTNIDELDFLLNFKNLKNLRIDNKQYLANIKIISYLINNGVLVYDEFTNVIGEDYV